jgi:hypothetical protein
MCQLNIIVICLYGALAQLARAPRLHRGGQGFESLMLHHIVIKHSIECFFIFCIIILHIDILLINRRVIHVNNNINSNINGHVPDFDIVKLTEDNLALAEKRTDEIPLRTENSDRLDEDNNIDE